MKSQLSTRVDWLASLWSVEGRFSRSHCSFTDFSSISRRDRSSLFDSTALRSRPGSAKLTRCSDIYVFRLYTENFRGIFPPRDGSLQYWICNFIYQATFELPGPILPGSAEV